LSCHTEFARERWFDRWSWGTKKRDRQRERERVEGEVREKERWEKEKVRVDGTTEGKAQRRPQDNSSRSPAAGSVKRSEFTPDKNKRTLQYGTGCVSLTITKR
jgi:hypothetical protein